MKKTAAAIISAAIILSVGTANADLFSFEELDDIQVETLGYTYISSISSSLSISNKYASCTSNVFGMSGANRIKVTQTLQKKSGGSWSNVKTWKGDFSSWYCNYYNSYGSLSSGTYRLKTVATVYSGSNSEKVTSYSNNVKC